MDEFNGKTYVSKVKHVKAMQIDKDWLDFLTKERGHSGISIGDYYVQQDNGDMVVFAKKNFERLFELEQLNFTKNMFSVDSYEKN
jgi:hypothetical protein